MVDDSKKTEIGERDINGVVRLAKDGSKRGGARKGAGRPKGSAVAKMVKGLGKMEASAHEALFIAVKNKESWAIKLFFEYMYGKPKQIIENHNTNFNSDFNIKDLYKTVEIEASEDGEE